MPAYDFGYSWTWTHGHLVVAVAAAALAAITLWLHWPRWLTAVLGGAALWALGGFLVVQFVLDANTPVELPTSAFLASGDGRVVDLGAGSGRSTLMVLLARPRARVTAFDLYSGYFGIDDNTPARIRANARAAGVEDRLDVRTGDMRALPFEAGSFDAAVSVASIDHLNAEGVRRALGEAHRVLRPGGEILLEVIHIDAWVRFAYPLPHGHSHYFTHGQPVERWRSALTAAGFEVVEQGTRPALLYFLARKPR
jgi:SAM-dependent methyltransferase